MTARDVTGARCTAALARLPMDFIAGEELKESATTLGNAVFVGALRDCGSSKGVAWTASRRITAKYYQTMSRSTADALAIQRCKDAFQRLPRPTLDAWIDAVVEEKVGRGHVLLCAGGDESANTARAWYGVWARDAWAGLPKSGGVVFSKALDAFVVARCKAVVGKYSVEAKRDASVKAEDALVAAYQSAFKQSCELRAGIPFAKERAIVSVLSPGLPKS